MINVFIPAQCLGKPALEMPRFEQCGPEQG